MNAMLEMSNKRTDKVAVTNVPRDRNEQPLMKCAKNATRGLFKARKAKTAVKHVQLGHMQLELAQTGVPIVQLELLAKQKELLP